MEDLDKTQSAIGSRTRDSANVGGAGGRLLVLDGQHARTITLPDEGTLLIGRTKEADLQLGDRSVSRRHASLIIEKGTLHIADLESHNGVRINGEPITSKRVLSTGDVVTIGEVVFIVQHAPRAYRPAILLDGEMLERRLIEEVARALEHERPLGLLAVSLGNVQGGRAGVGPTLTGALRLGEVAGRQEDGTLLIIIPDRGGVTLARDADRLRALLMPLAPSLRMGITRLPEDACEASALIAAARTAMTEASPGSYTEATRLATELRLGDRSVFVADPVMVRIYELLRRLAPSDLPVLITGETGAGKENAAYAIHAWSPRAGHPFVALNCATIPESLAESTLFGHEKGAFTGAQAAQQGILEAAHGGTLFLDEIGELPAAMQAKLLRALETKHILRVGSRTERAIDIRVVAATHRNLEEEVKAGRFREDLYFRLAAAIVMLPPLRDRSRELYLLGQRFLAAACALKNRETLSLAPSTVALLQRYSWPGNVRELKNTMEYLAATVEGEDVAQIWHLPERIVQAVEAAEEGTVTKEDADAALRRTQPMVQISEEQRPARPWAEVLREFEREHMAAALKATAGVKARAAERMGMPIRTFMLKCRQYGF
ncbi:MAG TPA: sigma 54-interacting transcriptional regulator [Polyangia bacterium]|nr:sigma 54-interacting transcriptional regulator [Polyangia bacterium]